MSHESLFVQNNAVALLLHQLSNDLKNIANQPNSLAAFFVARQLHQKIDDLIKKDADDNVFITALVFQAVEQNAVLLLKVLLSRLARHFGKSLLYRFLCGENDQRQSLLVFAAAHHCSMAMIQYLMNSVQIPLTEQVIFTALFANASAALDYFLTYCDKEDLAQNYLLRLSNITDAYVKAYGNDAVCEAYKAQINSRLTQRNLTLSFEKEEVPVSQPPSVPKSNLKSVSPSISVLVGINRPQPLAAVFEQQAIKIAITQTGAKLANLKTTLQDIKLKQRDVTVALARLSMTKAYLAAEAILKEPLAWSQRIRLALATHDNFFSRLIHSCLNYMGTPAVEVCQHNQAILEKAQQIIEKHKAVAAEVDKAFCKPKKLPLTIVNLQSIETDLLQQKQKAISQRKGLYKQQAHKSAQLSKLRNTLSALEKEKEIQPATPSPSDEMPSTDSYHNKTPALRLS